jgi:phosphoglucosamine mutase
MSSTKRQFFGTDGVRGKANQHPMTAEFALKLGMAVIKSSSPKTRAFQAI